MKRVLLFCTLAVCILAACKKDKKTASVATITTIAATAVTSNSATSGGEITDDGGSVISKRGVCFALHANPTVADSITSNGTGLGDFTSALTGLSAHATYYVRAYAINGSGTGYGNEISFTTADGVPTVTTTAITDIVALSAKSGGEVTNDGGAAVTARGVCWSTTANPTIDNFKSEDGTGTGVFASTLTPLASETTYYVRAYATNSHGTAYGNQIQFNAASANTVTDIDGNVYSYVTVCGQSWMASNLKVTKFKNGDPLVNGLTGFNFGIDATTYALADTRAAYTFPNGDANNDAVYGKLYNVYAVMDTRGICPTGWHVPTDIEIQTIEICQGMPANVADEPKDPNFITNRGTIGAKFLEGGSTGLNIQKAGYILPNVNFTYEVFNEQASIWISTSFYEDAGYETLLFRTFNVGGDPAPIFREHRGNQNPKSIRCVKD